MTLCLVAMTLGVAMTSCEKEGPNGSSTDTPLPGSITVKMRNGDNGSTTIYMDKNNQGGYAYVYINSANNFDYTAYNGYSDEHYDVGIASVGKVGGLGYITDVPSSGWSDEVSVFVGHGYVVRWRTGIWVGTEVIYVEDYNYLRLFVHDEIVSTGGGIIGYTVSYIEGM